MCWACNPMCGRCRPRRQIPVTCPTCGKHMVFDKSAAFDGLEHLCSQCGTDLSELVSAKPAFCKKCGEWCGYPCGSVDSDLVEGFVCKYRTPYTPREAEVVQS